MESGCKMQPAIGTEQYARAWYCADSWTGGNLSRHFFRHGQAVVAKNPSERSNVSQGLDPCIAGHRQNVPE
eukprot:7801994-Lingulodinium_polyedra.AAC.1